MNNVRNNLKILVLALLIGVGVGAVSGNWTPPTFNPPECPSDTKGCDEPLNVSSFGQVKHGGLSVGYSLNESALGLGVAHGNVGIGTLEPTQKLDVVGYVKGRTGICIAEDCRTTWPSAAGGGSGDAFWAAAGANISNTNTGNVGIGTNNPTAKLQVNGQVRITGGSPKAGEVLTATDNTGVATWEATPKIEMKSGTVALNDGLAFTPTFTPDFYEVSITGSAKMGGTLMFVPGTLSSDYTNWSFTAGWDGGLDDTIKANIKLSGNTITVKPTKLIYDGGSGRVIIVAYKLQ